MIGKAQATLIQSLKTDESENKENNLFVLKKSKKKHG